MIAPDHRLGLILLAIRTDPVRRTTHITDLDMGTTTVDLPEVMIRIMMTGDTMDHVHALDLLDPADMMSTDTLTGITLPSAAGITLLVRPEVAHRILEMATGRHVITLLDTRKGIVHVHTIDLIGRVRVSTKKEIAIVHIELVRANTRKETAIGHIGLARGIMKETAIVHNAVLIVLTRWSMRKGMAVVHAALRALLTLVVLQSVIHIMPPPMMTIVDDPPHHVPVVLVRNRG